MTGNSQAELFEAISCANEAAAPYTIDLDGQTVTLSAAMLDNGYGGPLGLPELTGQVTLEHGEIVREVTLPYLQLLSIAEDAVVTLHDLTLRGGRLEGGYGLRGGLIWSQGRLTITSSRLHDGEADVGGGIASSGTLLMVDCLMTGNRARYGGALATEGSGVHTVVASVFENNTVPEPGEGGALYNSGDLRLIASRVAGNSAFRGGGIANVSAASITNSIVVGNYGFIGGGLYASHATSGIHNSTIAGNAGSYGPGGLYTNYGTTTLHNTLVFGNSNSDGINPDLSETIPEGLGSLIGIDPGFVDFVPAAFENPTTGGDYRLTQGSAAIDAGVDSLTPQKLRSDYFGGLRLEGVRVDAGADEAGDSRVMRGDFELPGSEFIP